MLDWLAPQPLARAIGLPASCYTEPAMATREREAIFRRSWQLVGDARALATPGASLETEIAGLPLILVRDGTGVLRALHNVCRHRGGPLQACATPGGVRLRCRYHGWTYGCDGVLKSGPELEAMADLDRSAVRLPEARVVEWQGLVFVAIDPATPDFDELVAGIDARLASRPLSALAFHRRVSYEAACDWKAYVDNYLEGYHVPHIHPALNRLLDYKTYTTECERWHSLQWSPLDTDASFYGDGTAFYWWLWPNTMLNVLPGRLQTNRIVPTGPGRCRIDFDYYYAPGTEPARIAADEELAEVTQQEDIWICEQVQRAFASGSYDTGRVHPTREQGVHHFQELYRAALRPHGA